MSAPIAIWFHGLLFFGEPPRLWPNALNVIGEQMRQLLASGLYEAASECIAGINGGAESQAIAGNILPTKFKTIYHGLDSRNECSTLLALEEWLKSHAGWYIFYFHAKNSTHQHDDDFGRTWRRCMSRHLISNWRQCVADLDAGYDAVGSHWMCPPATPPGQYIFAGNFWWAKSSFLITLPSIMERDRIKVSGLKAVESRYEAEVWIGNGPRVPRIKDYHGPLWNPSKMATCL